MLNNTFIATRRNFWVYGILASGFLSGWCVIAIRKRFSEINDTFHVCTMIHDMHYVMYAFPLSS